MITPAAGPLDLHVTLRWRDDVLAFRRLRGDGAAAVGAHPDALAPTPCTPAHPDGFVFARLDRGAATAFAPDGGVVSVQRADGGVDVVEGPTTIALGDGDTAELAFGGFRWAASADMPVTLPPRRRRRGAGIWGAIAVAALAHAVVLGLAAQEALASSLEDRDDERADALRGLLASAELRARAEDPPVEDGAGTGKGRRANEARGDGRLGGGARALGEEGRMGDRLGHAADARRYAVPELAHKDPDPSAARAEALTDAAQFGMIGLLAQGPAVPSAPFADPWAHGADAIAANGALWAASAGESGGVWGLGLTGIGEGGGGLGEGIGLGSVGTLGHGDGRPGPGTGGEGSPAGRWGDWGDSIGFGIGSHGSIDGDVSLGRLGTIGHRTRDPLTSHTARPPRLRACDGGCDVSGRLPAEVIRRIVRQNFGRFRACYEAGLRARPGLTGRVGVRFVIGHDGGVSYVADGGSDIPDRAVTSCVVRAFYGLSFPEPQGGIVTVSYPIVFSPG